MDKYIGNKYGYVQIIEFDSIANSGHKKYKCLCICGKIFSTRLSMLKSGKSKSCGCLRSEVIKKKFWKGHGDISSSFMSHIKSGAILRNIEFNITIEYIWNLFLEQNKKCKYTGLNLYFPKTGKDKRNGNCNASLDRIDSSKGYIVGNVQWVHKHINLMKLNFDEKYFFNLCKLVCNNMN